MGGEGGVVKLLLDTCSFLWLAGEPAGLSKTALDAIRTTEEVYLSAVSGAEIAIKYHLGDLVLPASPRQWLAGERERHRILPLPLEEAAVLEWERLPLIHKDPFDRLLICQCLYHDLTLITPDPWIRKYQVPVLW